MGGRGSYSSRSSRGYGHASSSMSMNNVKQVATSAQATQANNIAFSDTDDSDFHQLYNGRQYFQSQTFGIDTRMAIQDYLSDKPDPADTSGLGYSPSQVLNHALRTGMKLNANQQFMVDSMNDGMHNLGYNVNLTRYTRVDFMQGLGASNFNNMTPTQLKKALVGQKYTDKAFVSTSYNDFANAPGATQFTNKAIKITYKAKANTQCLMPGNGPGGSLGEVVLKPNQSYKIVDAKFTGKQGRSGARWYNQVELVVEVG